VESANSVAVYDDATMDTAYVDVGFRGPSAGAFTPAGHTLLLASQDTAGHFHLVAHRAGDGTVLLDLPLDTTVMPNPYAILGMALDPVRPWLYAVILTYVRGTTTWGLVTIVVNRSSWRVEGRLPVPGSIGGSLYGYPVTVVPSPSEHR